MFSKNAFCTDSSKNAHWAFIYDLNPATKRGSLSILHVANGPFYLFMGGPTPYLSRKVMSSVEASEKEEIGQGKGKKVKYTCPCGYSSSDLADFLRHPFMEYPLERDEKDPKKVEEEEK